MIEQLTPEQEALIPIVRDEWRSRLNPGLPLNRKEAESGIKWLYEMCGLAEPEVIFVSSPLAAQCVANIIDDKQKAHSLNVIHRVRKVCAARAPGAWSEIESQLPRIRQVADYDRVTRFNMSGTELISNVLEVVNHEILTKLNLSVKFGQDSLSYNLRDELLEKIHCGVMDYALAYNTARAASVDSTLIRFRFTNNCGIGSLGWVALTDYIQRIGLDIGEDEPIFNRYKLLILSGICEAIQLDEYCVVCQMPIEFNRDETLMLHSLSGPAARWSDGFELYLQNN